ncbi:diguanylate cyclase [Hydrogenophaga sp. OTU3427]|uniref:diguanylate cyclase n=1 Tax=Hydrogenophaga sp. OTU3427 TaxID=3043856 RepID=UPI00313CC1BB
MTSHRALFSRAPRLLHRWCLWLLLCWGVPAWVGAQGAPLLVLGTDARAQALWPHLSRFEGETVPRDWTEARHQRERFVPLAGRHATLGLQAEPVWLHLDLQVDSAAAGARVLDIDYPPLNDVRLYLTRDGALVQQAQMGNLLPPAQRPLYSRSLATDLNLPAGRYELWLRVQTAGAMVLPITLSPPAVFHGRSLDEQLLQGLLTGLALCLLVYSVAQWLTLRDSLFLKYAVLTTGSLWFSLLLFGLGSRYLWPGWTWMEQHAGGFAALMAACGSFLFIEHSLRAPGVARWWSRLMRAGAALCATVATLYALDLLASRTVTGVMTLLGVAPALLGMRGAYRRARAGDEIGLTFLAAWFVYAVATGVVIGVIRGWMPVNFWTLHAFQFGATLDMLLFMRVLGLRTRAVERAARELSRERDVLQSLAHTDPLTGLANRRGLNAALSAALPQCGPQRLLAVFALDLDGFKPVNDRHGHDVGDELLVAVAQRLRAHIRSSDVVARVGGDEFVLMAEGLPDELAAHELGLKLRDAFNTPFEVQAAPVQVGLTLGYALAPTDGRAAVDLLKRADAAMYAGKQAGKHRLVRAGVPA